MDLFRFSWQDGLGPRPSSFVVADHLYLIDNSNIIVLIGVESLYCAGGEIADSELLVLSGDEIAVL